MLSSVFRRLYYTNVDGAEIDYHKLDKINENCLFEEIKDDLNLKSLSWNSRNLDSRSITEQSLKIDSANHLKENTIKNEENFIFNLKKSLLNSRRYNFIS